MEAVLLQFLTSLSSLKIKGPQKFNQIVPLSSLYSQLEFTFLIGVKSYRLPNLQPSESKAVVIGHAYRVTMSNLYVQSPCDTNRVPDSWVS
jgi:hypothetical protein